VTEKTGSSRAEGGQPPAIVIGGDENGLSVVRSLGRQGVPVYALGCSDTVRHSRFVRWASANRDPSRQARPQAEWLEWLTGEGTGMAPGAVLLACNDNALEVITRNRSALERHYVIGEGYDEAALAMLDKVTTYELAARAGVPAPRIWRIDSRRELEAALPELTYPCALKPRQSHLFSRHFEVKLLVARSEPELLERFDEVDRLGLQVLLTELISSADDQHWSYWTYVDRTGRRLFHFTKRKLRQYPIHFGMGTCHISVHSPEVAELGSRFVEGAGIRGIAIVEFKRDPRDGVLKLMECNARFPKATDISVRSGIDFPWLVYSHLTGRPLPRTDTFRKGVQLWFPLDDYRAFRSYRRAGELSWTTWLRSLSLSPRFAVFRWSDPGPACAEFIRHWAERLRRHPEIPVTSNGGGRSQSPPPSGW
jgi:D-aspartate ligase